MPGRVLGRNIVLRDNGMTAGRWDDGRMTGGWREDGRQRTMDDSTPATLGATLGTRGCGERENGVAG